jgi:hypothetical protein
MLDAKTAIEILLAVGAWTATVITMLIWLSARGRELNAKLDNLQTRIHRLEIRAFGFAPNAPAAADRSAPGAPPPPPPPE